MVVFKICLDKKLYVKVTKQARSFPIEFKYEGILNKHYRFSLFLIVFVLSCHKICQKLDRRISSDLGAPL